MDEAGFEETDDAVPIGDPAYQKAVFEQAYRQTCLQLRNGAIENDIRALAETNKNRNEAIDEAASFFASRNGAECASECSFCCHQMVLCTPLEVFDIAHHILDSKATIEIAKIKERLAQRAPLPLDEPSRYGSDKPCVLLEDHRCSIYDRRPSLCRTMLSTSRKACETSLATKEPNVPFIAEPVVISFLMQLGIDYAFTTLNHVSTEKVEMSRALSIALDDFEAAFRTWIDGKDAFPKCHIETGVGPSSRELAEMAAVQCGIV